MLKTACGILPSNVQYLQLRFAHRIRGKAPIYCRTIKERIDELNRKDELYTAKIDIGFPTPKLKNSVETQKAKREYLKKIKADKNLEKLSREHKIEVNLDEVKKDFEQTKAPLHRMKIAEHYGIFEHLYEEGYFIPHLNLEIHYDLKNDLLLPVYTGNVVKPIEALEAPSVAYETDGNSLYTLALTNLDGHLTENDKEYVHWLVANIPGNCIEKGDTLVEYLRPFPLNGTGYHRYVFVLYKQNGSISYDVPTVTGTSLEKRTFVTRDWYKQYQDNITPIGLAFYQSDWDDSVRDFFHKVLDRKEPVFEYDFKPPYIKPQEWFPHYNAFNMYMDKYRDPKQINKEYLIRKLKNVDPFKAPPPPLKYPNAHQLPKNMPSWLKLHEKKIRLGWGRVNDV